MPKKNIHLVPDGVKWAVKKQGVKQPLSIHRAKDQADRQARKRAKKRKVELVIHGKDGQIQDKDSFGNDPFPPKDKKY